MTEAYDYDFGGDVDSGPPQEPGKLREWERKNYLLTVEWETFWRRVEEHSEEFEKKRDQPFGSERRAMLCRELRKRLLKAYGSTDPSPLWASHADRKFAEDRKRRGM